MLVGLCVCVVVCCVFGLLLLLCCCLFVCLFVCLLVVCFVCFVLLKIHFPGITCMILTCQLMLAQDLLSLWQKGLVHLQLWNTSVLLVVDTGRPKLRLACLLCYIEPVAVCMFVCLLGVNIDALGEGLPSRSHPEAQIPVHR